MGQMGLYHMPNQAADMQHGGYTGSAVTCTCGPAEGPAVWTSPSDGEEYYTCDKPEANCQCSKSKIDGEDAHDLLDDLCGGPPGCWVESDRATCTQYGDFLDWSTWERLF